ncbi:hypothetical protein [Streptomyces sp. NPDC047928]|uniref:hypothetical protein n=1 Tax=unclassified Streptomyces TaxID=2593676 RepID=UPI00371903D6
MTRTRKAHLFLVFLSAAVAVAIGAAYFVWPREDSEDKNLQGCVQVLEQLGVGVGAPSSISECGDALETAMTGRPAGQPTKGAAIQLPAKQSAAFEAVARKYGATGLDGTAAPIPREIIPNLANAVTYYLPDVYQIIGGQVDYSSPDHATKPNAIDVDSPEMTDFLRGLAEDEASFRLVRSGMFEHMAKEIGTLTDGDFAGKSRGEPGQPQKGDTAIGLARVTGKVTGTLRKARLQAITAHSGEKVAEAARDYRLYGFPHLERLFRSRAGEFSGHSTPERTARLEDILSEARDVYLRRAGAQDSH